ncbi:hypothetical protein CANCADRAFT_2989 [Tortispora caseinolytica NRRL Y-17796]|uniref:Lysophospholipase n=1 Tax=Tortispora caseinolytica NRRL Y-17796 TaxID=767744 RepID=A0A1E4THU1_9ASCO|nr:hypothetical protein CANCADRAFT_2989 [Tortispora caseinolytica NRRL Y-17796]
MKILSSFLLLPVLVASLPIDRRAVTQSLIFKWLQDLYGNNTLFNTMLTYLGNSTELTPELSDFYDIVQADSYAPRKHACSARPEVSSPGKVPESETQYLESRAGLIKQSIKAFIERSDMDYDVSQLLENHTPVIGISFSGGGYRALLSGAGALAAFDSTVEGTDQKGHVGGVLQCASYISGISGGSWLVGSYIANNMTVPEMMNSEDIWNFEKPLFLPGQDDYEVGLFYLKMMANIVAKQEAGFATSFNDVWGQFLAKQLILDNRVNPLSQILTANGSAEGSTSLPYPIIVSTNYDNYTKGYGIDMPVMELAPCAFGSADYAVSGFVPSELLGTEFQNGVIPENSSCVSGYDNIGFVIGASSNLFNLINIGAYNLEEEIPPTFGSYAKELVQLLSTIANSTDMPALIDKNPFYGWEAAQAGYVKESEILMLSDGGESYENIPLQPQLQAYRGVDMILAFDSSRDTPYGWPNGTSIVAAQERYSAQLTSDILPLVAPNSPNTFINEGLLEKPVFFGCNQTESPLVVYIANSPYSFMSNTSTLQMSYTNEEAWSMVQNGYNVATLANSTDSNWQTCLACSFIHHQLIRDQADVPAACASCFSEFCWSGKENTTEVNPSQWNYQLKLSS